MRKLTLLLLALVALCLFHSPVTAQEEASYVVIVHPDNPAKSISKRRVSRLLLKEISSWEGGLSAQPVDLDSRSQTRSAFSRDVHGRSVSSIKNYWQRQIFSGGGVPPPEVASELEAINFVKSNPGGIGYVSNGTPVDGVKVVTITE